ncbi:MAG: hypothetical protein GY705_28995 [Bacteroidetes bacterium]|nr:hypothetical protein [Bacteroidota bacterium]
MQKIKIQLIKRILFSFSLLAFCSYNATGQWQEYKSFEGRFRVLTPGEFQENRDTVETPVGQLIYHTYFLQTDEKESENLFYMVSYCDYPENTFHADSTELLSAFFEETMNAAVESMKGELMYSSDIQFNSYQGKLWRINYLDGQAIVKTKAILVNSRYYAIQTITFKELSLNHLSDEFLDSFQLLE